MCVFQKKWGNGYSARTSTGTRLKTFIGTWTSSWEKTVFWIYLFKTISFWFKSETNHFYVLSLSPGGNGDLGSVMQLWENCKPRGLVTVHRCGVLTSSWWQQSQGALGCVRARTYGSVFPARGQKFVNGCRDCQHAWNSSRLQTTGDKFGGSKERGRGSLAKVFHSARAGETFPKIKGLLFFFTATI